MTVEHSSGAQGLPENQDSFRASFGRSFPEDHSGSPLPQDRHASPEGDDDVSSSASRAAGGEDEPASVDAGEIAGTEADNPDGTRPRRRRGSRGGRRRRGRGTRADETSEGTDAEGASTDDSAADDAVPLSVRARNSAPSTADESAQETFAFEPSGALDADEATSGVRALEASALDAPVKRKRRSRRGGRGRSAAATSDLASDDAPRAIADADEGPVEPLLPDEDDDLPPRAATVPRELDALDDDESAEARDEGDFAASAPDELGRKKRRRRGSRGGRRRKTKLDGEVETEGEAEDGVLRDSAETDSAPMNFAPTESAPQARAPAPRKAATRGGPPPRPKPAPRGAAHSAQRGGSSAAVRDRGVPGLRDSAGPARIDAIPGEELNDFPELPELPADSELLPLDDDRPREGGGRGRRKKRGSSRRDDKRREPRVQSEEDLDDDEPMQVPEVQRNALILVNATDPEEQRVSVVEGERIVDFQMTVKDQDSLVNDIYRGRVVNLEPAIGAAFIDFGQGRNGFLHTSDVLSVYGDKEWSLDKLLSTQIDPDEWDSGSGQPSVSVELADDDSGDGEGERSPGGRKKQRPQPEHKRRFRARPRLPITDLLKKGAMVVVQVTKDAIGDKGPTLTTYISIPGRYLVLMPSMSRTGVSRKIEDEKERRRLKRILQSLDVPAGMGVIVRTAGVGHSKAEIKRDLDYLKSAWEAFGNRLSTGHGPAPLYRESDVAIRTMRDLFTPNTKAVIVDDPEVHRHIVEFTEKLMPENVDRVKLHQGPRPLFQSYGIEPEFEKIFSRRIELPSGGSIVFDQAEALVAIDVNSGRTRSDGFDFEEIALKTNLEAVPEIARQIRLRDLGGIIVVDFIDMMKMSNIRTVEREFKEALVHDRARSKLGRISQFGLLELTRQRLGPGMSKKVFHPCPRCRGTGRIRTVNSRAAAILRRLAAAMTLKGFTTVEVKAHPEVTRYLKDSCSEYIRALEYRFQREVKVLDAPDQQEDSVLRYLRADGREVRPGGRRKR
jgi:ribonuclease E